jgi:hypothetical protein
VRLCIEAGRSYFVFKVSCIFFSIYLSTICIGGYSREYQRSRRSYCLDRNSIVSALARGQYTATTTYRLSFDEITFFFSSPFFLFIKLVVCDWASGSFLICGKGFLHCVCVCGADVKGMMELILRMPTTTF